MREADDLLALAVGKDRMGVDATNLVQILGNIQRKSIVTFSTPISCF